MNLTRTAITRPVFILMLMLAAFGLGLMSYTSMRVEQNPEVNFGVLTITTVYPGAGPEEINTLISRKLEEAATGVNGVREVTSTAQEGFSVVTANFEIGTNMDTALNDLRSKVDSLVNQLPQGIDRPTVGKFDTSSEPVLYMVLRSDKLNNRELRDVADDKFRDMFARIGGVAGVNVTGGDVREIQVQLKKDKLLAYGIGIAQVQRAVQAASINVPSGKIVDGDQEYTVRVLGEYQSIDELRDTRLSISNPNNPQAKGTVVRLGDIADIEDASVERTSYSRLDGSDAVVLVVQKAKEGNAVEISKAAGPVIQNIEKNFPVKIVKTQESAVQISEGLFDLNFALFFGIFLVAAIVYIFLHNMRGTMIVAIAIPVCIFATFIALKLFGFTINNMSMLALSLAVGVLVDDAIVVLENIYRHLKMGEDPREAAINGRAEIGLAAIAITLADVVVFLPIGFMGGIVGQFFKPLGIGFAVTVLLSLFVSFTVTPMLAARWYRKGEDMEHPTGRFAQWFERMFGKLERFYRRVLTWSLDHRWFIFVSGNIALVAVFMMIGGSFVPAVGMAIGMGMGLTIIAVEMGFAIFGMNYWAKALPRRTKTLGSILIFFASLVSVGMLMPAMPPQMPGPIAFLFCFILPGALSGIVAFFANFAKPRFKSRFILSALLFGLVFPVAAVAGFGWGQYKKEAVFKFGFFPPSDQGRVSVDIELPPDASLNATQRVVKRVEDIVMKHPDTKYVLSQVGTTGGGFAGSASGSNRAQVNVTLNDKKALLDSIIFWSKHEGELRTEADTKVAADMLEMIGRIPGASIKVAASGAQGFGSPIQMSFSGDNRELLFDTVSNLRLKLQNGAIPGVINADISSKPGKPELRAIPDRVRLADAGVTVSDLANFMRILYEGDDTTKFRVSGREYDIRVMMSLEDRNDPSIISTLPITFTQGNPIYVSQIADIQRGVGVDKIDRRDRAEEVRLTADLLPGYAAGSVQAQIDQWIAKEKLVPEGVRIKPLGQADVQGREMIYLVSALLIGLALVYMLLASLYDNLLYPLIIQMAQPQAMVGALLALMITDKLLNIVGFVGLITLVGLVGKNAILVVDYTNTLRSRGRERREALLEAGPTRLRPIMMTTLALILGIMPTALAIGRGSEFRETIGITIIGGITLSTLLTLLVIPCSYTIFDDLSRWIGGVFHPNRGEDTTPPAMPDEDTTIEDRPMYRE